MSATLMISSVLPPVVDRALLSPNQSLTPITTCINSAGHLEIGGCDLVELVGQFGSPLYIVDEATVRQTCRLYRDSFAQLYPAPSQVLYATKAWNCLALCALVRQEGLGLDVASGGELYSALAAGATGDQIVLHGNAKTAAELEMALEHHCTIVVDSEAELALLAQIAQDREALARIMLRVNPGIDVHTHEYIRTGQIDSKFGIGRSHIEALFKQIQLYPQLELIGIHAHIGSQIFALDGHRDLGSVLVQVWQQAQSCGLDPSILNVGGGLGVRHVESDDPPSIQDWVKAVSEGVQEGFRLADLPLPKLMCEPGRSLIGPSTVTAYTVGSHKVIPASPELPQGRVYVMVDGGMSDNPRPITYQAPYTALLANRPQDPARQTVTIAGKHCESGDLLIKKVDLPPTSAGDILVLLATGAYNYSMASNYNRFPRPAAVLVRDGVADLIIRRETYADLVRQDVVPSHLKTHSTH